MGSLLTGLISTAEASMDSVEAIKTSIPRVIVVGIYDVYDKDGKPVKNDLGLASSGSGVLVHKDLHFGTVITNSHVLPQEETIERSSNGAPLIFKCKDYHVFVVFRQQNGDPRIYHVLENLLRTKTDNGEQAGEAVDIAALRISSKGLPDAVPFKRSTVSPGTPVYALGYPGVFDRENAVAKNIFETWKAKEAEKNPYFTIQNLSDVQHFLNITCTRGEVQRVDEAPGTFSKVFHGAQIDHGNSGGPLLTEDGSIVGINTWGVKDGNTWSVAMSGASVVGMLTTRSVPFEVEKAAESAPSKGSAPSPVADAVPDTTMIYVIIGGVVLIVLIVVVVLVSLSGKDSVVLAFQVEANPQYKDSGRVFTLTEKMLKGGEVLIGRGDMCSWRMFDEHVSRAHCAIMRAGNSICIVDKGSKAGTKVNGVALVPGNPCALSKGAIIELGKIRAHIS